MLTTARDTRDFLKGVQERDKAFSEAFMAQFDPVQSGFVKPPDAIFKGWFEEQCMANPNWLFAGTFTKDIPGTDSFADDVRRYMRIVGEKGDGLNWKSFARALAVRYDIEKRHAAMVASGEMEAS